MLCAIFDIDIQVVHIEGHVNFIADLLPRWQYSIQDHENLDTYSFGFCTAE